MRNMLLQVDNKIEFYTVFERNGDIGGSIYIIPSGSQITITIEDVNNLNFLIEDGCDFRHFYSSTLVLEEHDVTIDHMSEMDKNKVFQYMVTQIMEDMSIAIFNQVNKKTKCIDIFGLYDKWNKDYAIYIKKHGIKNVMANKEEKK